MLAKRLSSLREKSDLTQAALAKKLGMARTTYSGYENGSREPDNVTMQRIADFYSVSVDYLLGRTNDPNLVMSEEARVFVDDLELTNEEFMEKHSIKVDGIPLTAEEIRRFREWVRMERQMSSLNK